MASKNKLDAVVNKAVKDLIEVTILQGFQFPLLNVTIEVEDGKQYLLIFKRIEDKSNK